MNALELLRYYHESGAVVTLNLIERVAAEIERLQAEVQRLRELLDEHKHRRWMEG